MKGRENVRHFHDTRVGNIKWLGTLRHRKRGFMDVTQCDVCVRAFQCRPIRGTTSVPELLTHCSLYNVTYLCWLNKQHGKLYSREMWITASRQCALSHSYSGTATSAQQPIHSQIGLGHQVRTPRVSWFWHFFVTHFNTLRTRSFKLFKRPFPGFLTILTL